MLHCVHCNSLYMPFSHVHTTSGNQPQKQYASCMFQNTSERGAFGDALAEVDWLVGNVIEALESNGIAENTLTLFTGVCLSFSVCPEVAMVHSKLTCLVLQVIMARG